LALDGFANDDGAGGMGFLEGVHDGAEVFIGDGEQESAGGLGVRVDDFLGFGDVVREIGLWGGVREVFEATSGHASAFDEAGNFR